MPDSLWRDSSALTRVAAPPKGAKAPKAVAPATAAAADDGLPPLADAGPAGSSAPHLDAKATVSHTIEAEGGAGGLSEAVIPDANLMDDATKEEVMRRARIVAEVGDARGGGAECRLQCCLKSFCCRSPRVVALPVYQMGAIRPLISLCNGPEGPLPDLEAKAAAAAEAADEAAEDGGDKKKKKKPKKKKGKKGKLEPGVTGSAVTLLA